MQDLEVLENKIIEANRAYNLGQPSLSDEAFDELVAQLPEAHGLRGYVGERGTSTHTHSPKMLSLAKVKTPDEAKTWAAGIADDHHVLVMPKLDGVACLLVYVNGQFVAAYTRGDGLVGEDITKAVCRLHSVPQTSPYPKVKGELVIDKEAFEKLKLAANYTISRSAVVGLISKNDAAAAAEAGVRFIAYDAQASKHQNAPDSLFARLQTLANADFTTAIVYHQCKLSLLTAMTLASIRIMAQNGVVDTDGIVIRFDSVKAFKQAGATEHHPHGALALKHPNTNVWTTLTDVRWQVGRSGAVTPVVEVKPVVAEGAEISRATLHNMKQFLELKPNVGARVELKRSGGVIPFVMSIEPAEGGRELVVPTCCPSCEGALRNDGTALYCDEASQAPERCREAAVSAMCHFAATIGIDGVGPAIAEALFDDGAVRGPDLYLAAKKGKLVALVGEKTAQSITNEVWDKSELPLSVIIEACGIERIGKTHAKTLAARCPHTDPQEVLTYFDSLAWADGFGAVESARMRAGYQKRRDIFALALKRIKLKQAAQAGPLIGKGFCFTGVIDIPRTQAESYVEDLGGICQSGVSKKTDYLVCSDAEANSAKYKRARELQDQGHPIRIIGGSDFKRLISDARDAQ
jgi:DNA ligase (NAD+)